MKNGLPAVDEIADVKKAKQIIKLRNKKKKFFI